jgi:uncharacterized membrane protein
MQGWLFAVLAGASAATWTLCLKLGSTKINAALGAMVITAVAFVVNTIAMLTMRAQGHEIVLRQEAFGLLTIAGIAAAGVDVFALLAYERGLPITASLIIGGTSTALVGARRRTWSDGGRAGARSCNTSPGTLPTTRGDGRPSRLP